MIDEKFLQKAFDTGAAVAGAHADGLIRPHFVRPPGYSLEPLESEMLAEPWRLQQTVHVFDPKSFTDYFTDYCNAASRIFIDQKSPAIVGVLDYHELDPEEQPHPKWCQHIVSYIFRHTPEWAAWYGKNRQPFKHVEFARFIEDNLPDIIHPAHAEMLQMSRTMEAKKNVNFSSGVRLQTGEIQLVYTEETKGSAAQDTMEIPEIFRIKIAPFEGSEAVPIDCRFRYTIKENALELRYEMVRPHKIVEAAVARVVEQIRGAVTNPITFGTAV